MDIEELLIIFLIGVMMTFAFYTGQSDGRRNKDRYEKKVSECMKAGHERLWCVGLLSE